jgi:hypothetical protein
MDAFNSILSDLQVFIEKFGNQSTILNKGKISKKEKNKLKEQIEIKMGKIRAKDIHYKEKQINKIQELKSLSCQEDYYIFDNLINILQGNNYYDEDIDMTEYSNQRGNSNSGYQQDKLVDKQLIKQKISEEYTNDMLGRAISKAENFSTRFGKNQLEKQFNYYNRFDNGFIKDKNNLLKSLMNALDTLQDYYEMDGDKKRFPSNFNQNRIISYIEKLKNNCHRDDQGIFDDFITIIRGGHVNFDNNFNLICKADPNVLAQSGVSSMKFASRQEKEWKEKAMKYGNYPCKLEINQNWENNHHIPSKLNNYNDYC